MSSTNLTWLIVGIVALGGIIAYPFLQKDTAGPTHVSPEKTPQANLQDIQVLQVSHNGRSLVPEQIVLQAGGNYDIQITPTSDGIGCMFEATVPKIAKDTYKIEAGKTFSINVRDAKPGTYPVVCTSMGMSQGEIVVQG